MNETVNIKRVSNEKVKQIMNKAWYIIAGFILAFGIPLLAASYIVGGGGFWNIYIRFWAISGLIFGFLIGIPTGMVIAIKLLFNKTEV